MKKQPEIIEEVKKDRYSLMVSQIDIHDDDLGVSIFLEERFGKYKMEIMGFSGSDVDWEDMDLAQIKGLISLLEKTVEVIESVKIGKQFPNKKKI